MTRPALTPAALVGATVPLGTGPDSTRRLRACRRGHAWAVLPGLEAPRAGRRT